MKLFVLALIVLLSACSGIQYKQPTGSESSAKLYVDAGSYWTTLGDKGLVTKRMKHGTGTIYINTVDDGGCYTGRTAISKSIRLYANKNAILAYEDSTENVVYQAFCRIFVSFVPEKNEKYKFIGKSVDRSAVGDNKPHCSVSIKRMDSDVPVAIKRLKLHQAGLACIKFRPY